MNLWMLCRRTWTPSSIITITSDRTEATGTWGDALLKPWNLGKNDGRNSQKRLLKNHQPEKPTVR